MTKEELKKEAIKYAVDYPTSYGKGYKHKDLRIAYLAGAEPREKRIAELEKRCANYEMTISKMERGTCDICKETEKDKKIEALEQQIEKMKCCGNCTKGNCVNIGQKGKACAYWTSNELRR